MAGLLKHSVYTHKDLLLFYNVLKSWQNFNIRGEIVSAKCSIKFLYKVKGMGGKDCRKGIQLLTH